MATLGRGVGRDATVKVGADTSELRRDVDRATRGQRAEVDVDADISPAQRAMATLAVMWAVLAREKKIRVTADTSSAVAAVVALRSGLDAGGRAIDRFNRSALVMRNVAGVAARVAILGLVGAIGPLIGIATMAGAALTVLALGAGLLAAPLIASVAAMGQHEAASEALAGANEQLEQRTEALADAEENLQRVQEDATRSVEQAAQARADAAEQYRRTQIQAEESVQDARDRVADQERSLAEAQRQNAEQREQAQAAYRASVEDLSRIETENTERLRQAYQARREAEAEYARVVAENRRRVQEATEALRTSEEELADAREEATRMVEEARVAAEERYESALEAARDAADRTEQAEESLRDSRERSIQSLEDLRAAQQALNEAMEDEPRRRAEAALDVRESELQLSQLEQELREARTLGDTDRASELEIRVARLRLQLDEERDRLGDLQSGPSPELQRAREQVEDAWRARQRTLEEEAESRERLRDVRMEEQEARAGISEARRQGAEEVRAAQEEAASLVENAIGRVLESRQALTRAQQESAASEREAARAITESQQEIRRTVEENRLALEEGRERARADYEALIEARRSGAAAVAEQERALAEAIEQQSRTARQARWDVMDSRDALRQSAEEERLAQVQAGRDIQEAQRGVREAVEDVGRAQDEVAEKAEATGAKLTASQAALYAAALGFAAAFSTAFAPAQNSLNMLGVEVLGLAEQALPYLGGIALQTAEAMHRVFAELSAIWQGEGQLALFRRVFDAVPGIMEDAVAAVGKFATGVFNVFSAAVPFVEDFFEWLDRQATRFLEWTQSLSGQRQLQEFFEDASFYAGIFADIIRDVFTFLFRIGQSEGAQRVFQNVAEFVDWLATNRGVRRGIQTALWLFGRLGDILLFIANIPIVGSVGGFTLAFGALFALLGGGIAFSALTFLFTFGRALGGIRGVARLARGALNLLRAPFVGVGRWAASGVRSAAAWFGRLPGLIWRGVRGIPGLIVRALGGIPRLVGRILGGVPRVVFGIFRGAGRWFSPLISTVARIFGGGGGLALVLRGFGGVLARIISGPAGWLFTLASFATTLNRWASNLGRTVGDALGLTRIGPWILNRLGWLGDQIRRVMTGEIGGTMADFQRLLSNIVSGLGNWLSGAFRWIGETMVWGWISGLWDRARDLWNTLIEMARQAWQAVRSFFESRSPSEKMRREAHNHADGWILGVRDRLAQVRAMSDQMALAAAPDIGRVAVRVPVGRVSGAPVAPGAANSAVTETRELLRGLPGYGVPMTIPVNMTLNGKKLGEVVIQVVNGEAREARRIRGQMAPAGLAGGRY